jgi:hypothetical protein
VGFLPLGWSSSPCFGQIWCFSDGRFLAAVLHQLEPDAASFSSIWSFMNKVLVFLLMFCSVALVDILLAGHGGEGGIETK